MEKRIPLHELLPLEAPLTLLIDICDICNFKCDFCFRHYYDYNGQLMDFDLFRKIVDEIRDFKSEIKSISLYAYGEPLINPDVADYISYIKEVLGKKQFVSITSNGSLLEEGVAHRLCKAGLDQIIVSVLALDTDAYKRFAHNENISFDQIVKNVKCMYDVSKEHYDGVCSVRAKINGEFLTETEKEKFTEIFGGITDECILDRDINNWPGTSVISDLSASIKKHKVIEEWRTCPQPFYQMVIHSNGKVSPCCIEFGQELIVGDVNKESVAQIWNGEKWNNLRRRILTCDKPASDVCAKCDYSKYGATENITPYRKELSRLY